MGIVDTLISKLQFINLIGLNKIKNHIELLIDHKSQLNDSDNTELTSIEMRNQMGMSSQEES